jgi:hypothetical protein
VPQFQRFERKSSVPSELEAEPAGVELARGGLKPEIIQVLILALDPWETPSANGPSAGLRSLLPCGGVDVLCRKCVSEHSALEG